MLLKPSITFDGQAEEALNFYQSIFDAKIVNLCRYGDAPCAETATMDESDKKRLANARLDFGNNKFSVCDSAPGETVIKGNNIDMDIVFSDDNDIRRIFEALAVGGEIIIPLIETFFSPNFGKLVDKFGIHWTAMQMPQSEMQD